MASSSRSSKKSPDKAPVPLTLTANKETSSQPPSPTYEEKLWAQYDARHNPDPKVLAKRLDSMHKDIRSIEEKWKSSEHREAILEFLDECILPIDGFRIENALCLGLGSFGWVMPEEYATEPSPRAEWFVKNHSFHQLLVFETVVDVLSKRPFFFGVLKKALTELRSLFCFFAKTQIYLRKKVQARARRSSRPRIRGRGRGVSATARTFCHALSCERDDR